MGLFASPWPSIYILYNYRTVSKSGHWLWYNLQSWYRFHQLYLHSSVCVLCVCMCSWMHYITHVALCNYHSYSRCRTVPLPQGSFILIPVVIPTLQPLTFFPLPILNPWQPPICAPSLQFCYFENIIQRESYSIWLFEVDFLSIWK